MSNIKNYISPLFFFLIILLVSFKNSKLTDLQSDIWKLDEKNSCKILSDSKSNYTYKLNSTELENILIELKKDKEYSIEIDVPLDDQRFLRFDVYYNDDSRYYDISKEHNLDYYVGYNENENASMRLFKKNKNDFHFLIKHNNSVVTIRKCCVEKSFYEIINFKLYHH